MAVLREEFQEADIPFGCKGELPISNFQNILMDYDMPMIVTDEKALREKGLLSEDKEKNKFVLYQKLL